MSDTSSSTTSGAKSMAELMASHTSKFATFTKGQQVVGTITSMSSKEITMDIGGKTDAVLLEKERHNMKILTSILKVGEKVTAGVLDPESNMGHPVVSLRRFLEQIVWERLATMQKEGKLLDVLVDGASKAGFFVTSDLGITGFLPQSQLVSTGSPQELLNKRTQVYIIDLNKQQKKMIVSQRPYVDEKAFDTASKNLKVDQKIPATIISITSFGIFVSLMAGEKQLDGLVHISEVSWEKAENLESLFKVGQDLEVVVIGFDKDAKRVDVSIKRLTKDPVLAVLEALKVEQKISGVVTRIGSMGVQFDLTTPAGESVEGMLRKEKIPAGVTYEDGQKVDLTISEIDTKRRRLIVSPVLLRKTIGYR